MLQGMFKEIQLILSRW